MKAQVIKALNPFAGLWAHRQLILAMTRREVAGKYKGSWLGSLWSLLTPLAMLAVYGFVFGVVFQARWGTGESDTVVFAASLFCGLAVFGLMAEVLNRSPEMIVQNVNYVKKVVFPLETLAWVTTAGALVHYALAMVVLTLFLLVTGKGVPIEALLVPILVLPLVLMLMGISWAISALGVFFRDVNQIMPPLTTALLFLSPALYPLEMVPEGFRAWLQLNPITPTIEFIRQAVMHASLPSGDAYLTQLLVSLIVLSLGHALFFRLRKGFADCL